jgi:hypothetical protein
VILNPELSNHQGSHLFQLMQQRDQGARRWHPGRKISDYTNNNTPKKVAEIQGKPNTQVVVAASDPKSIGLEISTAEPAL